MINFDLRTIVEMEKKYCNEVDIKDVREDAQEYNLENQYDELLLSSYIGFSSSIPHISELCITELYLIAFNSINPEKVIDAYMHCLYDYMAISEYPNIFKANVDHVILSMGFNEMIKEILKISIEVKDNTKKAYYCISLMKEKYNKYFQ